MVLYRKSARSYRIIGYISNTASRIIEENTINYDYII